MVRLREIPRTATFAWSPGAASPLIATGTRAGAVDADFSNKTCLELWDLGLDREDASEELQPLAKIDTDAGYDCHPGLDGEQSADRILCLASTISPGLHPRTANGVSLRAVWRTDRWIYGTLISYLLDLGWWNIYAK
jgi:hypothetical protein